VRPHTSRRHLADLLWHSPPGWVSRTPGAGGVVKIFGTRVGFGVEHVKPSG